MREAGFAGDVGEGAIAVVVEEDDLSPEGDEEVVEAVVVVVADADSLSQPVRATPAFWVTSENVPS